MSFSSMVKEEVSSKHTGGSIARHCALAELCGFTVYGAETGESTLTLHYGTDSKAIARRIEFLLKKTFQVTPEVRCEYRERRGAGDTVSGYYELFIKDPDQVEKIFQAMKLEIGDLPLPEMCVPAPRLLLSSDCCRRSFFRSAFLMAGTMSNPEKSYHFELPCRREEQALQLTEILESFGMNAKITRRKKYHVVYMKGGDQISDLLGLLGAHKALLDMENTRIYKEMREQVNRDFNFEMANLNKTVNAATEQTEEIMFIDSMVGLSSLPAELEEIARLRLASPESSLKELGELCNPPVGKSGVNHRLRRLKKVADNLRKEKGLF
ncbi:MAG: DNA-binding protein WhiA [Lachnospiraceae bacterium]|nr:DNA-binding protein WhiA [Lachnospiraceae bacterium]